MSSSDGTPRPAGRMRPVEGVFVVDGEEYVDSAEAARLLGVKRETLYAYVSRGLLRSYRQGIKRQRLYRRGDIEALLRLEPSPRSPLGAGQPPPRLGNPPRRILGPRLTTSEGARAPSKPSPKSRLRRGAGARTRNCHTLGASRTGRFDVEGRDQAVASTSLRKRSSSAVKAAGWSRTRWWYEPAISSSRPRAIRETISRASSGRARWSARRGRGGSAP